MKLRDLIPPDNLQAADGDIEITGITADSRAVKPDNLFVAVPGTKTDGLRIRSAGGGCGRRGGDGGAQARGHSAHNAPFVEVPNARRALALAAAKFFPRQPRTIAAVTGTSGKTSVAAFTRQIWQALGHAGGQRRHRRRRLAGRRNLRLADDARPGRTAPHARGARGRWRHASRDGSVLARPRSVPARRRAHRGRRLHQSQPRSSRLSSERRSLSECEAAAVRGSRCDRRQRGGRDRSSRIERGDRCRARARAARAHGRANRPRHQV